MTLIPIYDSSAVIAAWPVIAPGIVKLMSDKCNAGDNSIAKIYNELLKGTCLLSIAYIDNKYAGFIVTKVIDTPFTCKALHIEALFSVGGKLSDEIWGTGLDYLLEMARVLGCKNITMQTVRDKAFEKILEPMGWKPVNTMFRREVE